MSDEIIQVAPMDKERTNSEITEKISRETTVVLGKDQPKCIWNDEKFDEASIICDNGVAYKCHMGVWVKQDDGC